MVDFSALFKKKEDHQEYYFGLFLRGDSAVGFLFEIKDGVVSQIAKETCKYSNGWEGILDDIDELLSVLENETQIHIDQCIFFVYSYFIDQATQEIKEPYKDVIKRISKELELKPMGYIECHEAVKDMLEKKEASPLNGVLVELDHNHLSYYVYKGGKMIHTDQTPRTDSVVDDLSEMFAQNKDHFLLPSKVILYGSSSLDKEAAEIKENTWEKDLFIQSPRVSVVKNEDVLNGLSHTFMEQINKELSGTADPDPAPVPAQAADTEPEEEVAATEAEAVAETDTDEETAQAPAPKKAKPAVAEDDGIPDEAEAVGFMIGGDVADDADAAAASGVHMGMEIEQDTPKKAFKMPKLPKFQGVSLGKGAGAKAAVGAAAVVVLLAAGTFVEYNFHKAHLTIVLPSNKISDTFAIEAPYTASGEGDFKIDKKVISKDAKKSIATSGQREVGEKAKGTVILNNFEDKSISYSAGTKLSADGLTYTLDSDVTIASASASVNTIQAQTKEAGVTAEKIGSEYNIDKDKKLNVAGATSRNFAVAKTTFSGGTKKNLKTIAKKDLDTLQKEILDSEKNNLVDEVKSQVGPNQNVISDLTEIKIGKANYSGEVGQEATDVSLSAEVDISYYVFDDTNLKKEISSRLQKNVPSGFEIDKHKLAYDVKNSAKQDADINMDVKGEATVVKTVDKSKVLASLTGKSIDQVRKVLKEQFDAEDVTVKENSSPLFLNSILPFSTKNIEVTFTSE